MTSSPAPQTGPADFAIWRMSGDETTTQLMVGAEAVHLDRDRLEDCDCTCGEGRCAHLRAAAAYQGAPLAWIAELDAEVAAVEPSSRATEPPPASVVSERPGAVTPPAETTPARTQPARPRRRRGAGQGHRCSRCGQDKPAEAFGYDPYNCLACVRERIAGYRARKKAASQA